MFQNFRIILFAFFSLSSFQIHAQTTGGEKNFDGNSPYSRIGFGDIAPIGTLRNIGMGGIGVSSAHPEFINSMNPALLPNNRVHRYDSLLTILEGTITSQLTRISNNNSSAIGGSVNFNSFAYLFPITKRLTTSIGLRPFSSVNYSFAVIDTVLGKPSDSASYSYTGSGGIYQADFSNGMKVTKNLNLGLQISYLFGSIHNESFSQLISFPDAIVGSNHRTTYTGFMFRPGAVYRKQLNKHVRSDSSVFINLGFTYDFFANLGAKESLFIERRDQGNNLLSRTVTETTKKNITFPPSYRWGINFDKYASWNIGADFSYSNWNAYNGTNNSDTLKNSYSLSIGGEVTINNENNIFKKKYLRAGMTFAKTPLYFHGNQLNDISFSIGYTFSVGRRNLYGLPLPKVNIAFVLGQRGTIKDNLIRDQYIKAYLGVTLNDKWFRRRRLD